MLCTVVRWPVLIGDFSLVAGWPVNYFFYSVCLIAVLLTPLTLIVLSQCGADTLQHAPLSIIITIHSTSYYYFNCQAHLYLRYCVTVRTAYFHFCCLIIFRFE
ncbi:hypothetical protein V1512DRAFT_268270 [Lipomyces arxii]|uniref:uncharacterized protein n=1 Tax=Lipomyces arxii TaxID=56418 RepID=UPI0034CEC794